MHVVCELVDELVADGAFGLSAWCCVGHARGVGGAVRPAEGNLGISIALLRRK